jgi:hypothetical protein
VSTDPTQAPSRYVNLEPARARHGERVDRLGRYFNVGDPLADAASEALAALPATEREATLSRALAEGARSTDPEALRALLAQCERVPFWVDFDRCDRGGAMFLRTGLAGGLILGSYSLTAGYLSPAGNKPLAFSGRLTEQAPRRLAETGRFVQQVSLPGGMRPRAEGWRITVRVRLMHASVRRMLLRSPRWDRAAWGLPINQADSAGTILLFSLVVLDGLDKLGFVTDAKDRADFLHLWRWVAWVIGVDDDLRFSTEDEAAAFWDLLKSTQAEPDDDSRALARALLDSPVTGARNPAERARAERMRSVGYALSRYFMGDRYADALGYPRSRAVPALALLRRFNRRAGLMWRVLPTVPFGTAEDGARYWRFVVEQGLRGVPAAFAMPDALGATPPA